MYILSSRLCECLNHIVQTNVNLLREEVDKLVNSAATSPEVMDNEIDACIDSEAASTKLSLVNAPFGLFPKAIDINRDVATNKDKDNSSTLHYFEFLGKFVGQVS